MKLNYLLFFLIGVNLILVLSVGKLKLEVFGFYPEFRVIKHLNFTLFYDLWNPRISKIL